MFNYHPMTNKVNYSLILSAVLMAGLMLNSAVIQADFDAAEAANQKGDRETAFHQYQAAVFDKDARAYGKLASMYLYGLGTKKNYTQAYVWFEMARLSGDRYAGRFRDAAASMMSSSEYQQVVKQADKQRIILGLPEVSE